MLQLGKIKGSAQNADPLYVWLARKDANSRLLRAAHDVFQQAEQPVESVPVNDRVQYIIVDVFDANTTYADNKHYHSRCLRSINKFLPVK